MTNFSPFHLKYLSIFIYIIIAINTKTNTQNDICHETINCPFRFRYQKYHLNFIRIRTPSLSGRQLLHIIRINDSIVINTL